MDIAERLKLLRGKESRESLAKKLDIHPQTLYRYENGERDVPLDVIVAFCRYYDISSEWLIFGKEKNTDNEADALLILRARIAQLEKELIDAQRETIKAYRLATEHMQAASDAVQKPKVLGKEQMPIKTRVTAIEDELK